MNPNTYRLRGFFPASLVAVGIAFAELVFMFAINFDFVDRGIDQLFERIYVVEFFLLLLGIGFAIVVMIVQRVRFQRMVREPKRVTIGFVLLLLSFVLVIFQLFALGLDQWASSY